MDEEDDDEMQMDSKFFKQLYSIAPSIAPINKTGQHSQKPAKTTVKDDQIAGRVVQRAKKRNELRIVITRHLIGKRQKSATVYPAINGRKPIVIMKRLLNALAIDTK